MSATNAAKLLSQEDLSPTKMLLRHLQYGIIIIDSFVHEESPKDNRVKQSRLKTCAYRWWK